MSEEPLIIRGKKIVEDLVDILKQSTDSQIMDLLGDGALDQLLKSIFDPREEKEDYPNLQEFLLANKWRATLVALLRYAITHNYSFKGITEDGKHSFISPSYIQWFDDGVMFLQSDKRFEGLIGLYRKDKTLSYAVVARDIRKGEQFGPDHLEFINESEYRERQKQFPRQDIANLDAPIKELQKLLNNKDNNESKYQELLIKYPWALGAKYKEIQRHSKLDDKNIPDFSGVRITDNCRDIFEIKPPFTKFFRSDGGLSANFNEAWSQAERYLDFARRESEYLLRQKGVRFENPKCYLILGVDLTLNQIEQIHTKMRMNPAIELLTYDDLLAQMKWTVTFIRGLQNESGLLEREKETN